MAVETKPLHGIKRGSPMELHRVDSIISGRSPPLYCTTCVTPTCVAPRHVDAPRDFFFNIHTEYIFSPNEQRAGGGGGCAARLFLFLFFPV